MADTDLGKHRRGDTFSKTFTLGGGFLGAMFSEVWFTIRDEIPSEIVVTDTSANGMLAQATKTGSSIVFDVTNDAKGTITIAATVTTAWPVGSYVWDLQGKVTGSPDEIYTIDSGGIKIIGDVTRSA